LLPCLIIDWKNYRLGRLQPEIGIDYKKAAVSE